MNTRGSLSIGTNAIVVLIIAVVMLGLILTFVTDIFDDVTAQLREGTANEPSPGTPNTASPIMVSSAQKIVSRGDEVFLKVAILNSGDSDLAEVVPFIKCVDDEVLATKRLAFPKNIDASKTETFDFGFQIASDANTGTTLCQVKAIETTNDEIEDLSASDTEPLSGAEFRLTVED